MTAIDEDLSLGDMQLCEFLHTHTTDGEICATACILAMYCQPDRTIACRQHQRREIYVARILVLAISANTRTGSLERALNSPCATERIIADAIVGSQTTGEYLEAITLLRVESADNHRAVLAVGSEQIIGRSTGNSQITEQFCIRLQKTATATHTVGSKLGVSQLNFDISSSIGCINNRIDVIQRRTVAGNLFVANVIPIMAIDVRRGSNNATRTTIHTKVEVERTGNGFCIGETEQANSRKKKR